MFFFFHWRAVPELGSVQQYFHIYLIFSINIITVHTLVVSMHSIYTYMLEADRIAECDCDSDLLNFLSVLIFKYTPRKYQSY
jgi:hypothetical protein